MTKLIIGTYLVCTMSLPLKVPGHTRLLAATVEATCLIDAVDYVDIPRDTINVHVDCRESIEWLFRDMETKPLYSFWTKYGEDCH